MGKILYLGDDNFSIFLKSYNFDTINKDIVDNFVKSYKSGDYTIIIVSEMPPKLQNYIYCYRQIT